ncbi:hypothetical protein D3C72_1346570 [compost metagenome]
MKLTLATAILLAAFSAEAKNYGESTTGVFNFTLALPLTTSGGVIYTTASFSGETQKLILAAKEDAAFYVATEGQAHTARLDSALKSMRNENPTLQASDLHLAQVILNF